MPSYGASVIPFLLATFLNDHFPVPSDYDVAADPRVDLCPGGVCCAERTVPVDGMCLAEQESLTKGCWITAQCKAEGSVCRGPAGRYIYSVPHKQWEAYKRGNRTQEPLPGKCECRAALVIRSVSGRNGTQLVCSERRIGSACRSHYECGQRVRFSDCKHHRCVCSRPRYVYERATDLCIPAGKKIAYANGTFPDAPFLLMPTTLGHQSLLVFCFCITILLTCGCLTVARAPTAAINTQPPVYKSLGVQKVSADEGKGRDEPPPYDEVVPEKVKLLVDEDQIP